MVVVKWKRETRASYGGSCYRVRDDAGNVILHVHRQQHCGFWYVFVGVDQDEADGTRFRYLFGAKKYAERQIERNRVSLNADTVTCSECLEEFPRDELTDGVCDCCCRKDCEACDGTGTNPDSWGEDGPEDCEECGGDGVI